MKKYIISFLMIFIFLGNVNANDDDGATFTYSSQITPNINANFTLTTNHCDIESNYNYSGNINSISNFNFPWGYFWNDWNYIIRTSWFSGLDMYINWSLNFKRQQILKEILVPYNIRTKIIDDNIIKNYSVKTSRRYFPLLKINENFDLWSVYEEIDNSDCDECQKIEKKEEIKDKDGNKKIKITKVDNPNKPAWCDRPTWIWVNSNPITITDPPTKIDDDKISPELEFDFSWNNNCKKMERPDWKLWYSCYATESLDFSVKVTEKWKNPEWINKIRYYFLNPNDNSRYVDTNWIRTWTWWVDIYDNKTSDFNFSIENKYFKKEEKYRLELSWWHIWDGWNSSNNTYIYLNIVPNPNNLKIVLKDWTNSWDKNKYANYFDRYNYDLHIEDKFWNPIHDKKIEDLKCNWDNCLKDNNNKLSVIAKEFNNKLDKYWKWKFHIISAVPWTIDEKFLWKMNKWDVFYKDINPITKLDIKLEKSWQKDFKKPIIFDNVSVEWWAIDISKKQKYTIKLKNPGKLSGYSNWQIDADISLTDENFIFSWWLLQEEDYYFWGDFNSYLWFSTIIKALKNDSLLSNLWIQISNMFIDYTLIKNWENFLVKYDLSDSSLASCPDRSTLWLVINWTLQWIWKQLKSWLKNNFTDLSKFEVRWEIRKNAYLLTRWLEKWMYLNWILYIEWDKKYSEIKNKLNKNDTIIIKNWNFTIDENITKNIWIIVLKDNYDVKSDYKNTWNVYVKKTVSNINAYIYADWWFISWYKNNYWDFVTYTDKTLRENTLDLKWSLFTKNTIGWSEKWDTICKLPWWEKTDDCSLAEKYDLHYIRKMIICDKDDYSFKITYNPEIQTNPPKGFIK